MAGSEVAYVPCEQKWTVESHGMARVAVLDEESLNGFPVDILVSRKDVMKRSSGGANEPQTEYLLTVRLEGDELPPISEDNLPHGRRNEYEEVHSRGGVTVSAATVNIDMGEVSDGPRVEFLVPKSCILYASKEALI